VNYGVAPCTGTLTPDYAEIGHQAHEQRLQLGSMGSQHTSRPTASWIRASKLSAEGTSGQSPAPPCVCAAALPMAEARDAAAPAGPLRRRWSATVNDSNSSCRAAKPGASCPPAD